MKKIILSVVSLVMVMFTLVPTTFAANEQMPEWQYLILTH